MPWPLPMDGQFATYAYAPPLLLAAVAAVAALHAFETLTRRIQVSGRRTAALVATLAAAVGGWLALEHVLARGSPAADLQLAQAFAGLADIPRAAAVALSWALSFPFALAALFGLFAWAAKKGRWVEAYFALFAGPGLAAVLIAFKVTYPRWPPGIAGTPVQPFFTGPTGFPNDVATLVPAFIVLWGVLSGRLRPGRHVPWPLLGAAAIAAAFVPLLAGHAWATDVLGGLLLGAGWLAAALMALDLATGWNEHPRSVGHALLNRIDALGRRAFGRPMVWLYGLILFGVALRVATYWTLPLAVDAYSYAAMSRSFMLDGSFTMPWGDVGTFFTAPAPSHHYPPLYPVYLAGFYTVLGFSAHTTHIAAIASSLAAMLVTYLCTRDLYGHLRALVVTAVVGVSPILVQNTGQGYSENLVLLLFVATLWAILKSLERPWFIVAAGILAGLGYLTKSTMGPFFVIAGLGGLAWRLYWKGWKVLRDPPYLIAIASFGTMIVLWAWRNIRLFGSWDTSFHITDAYQAAIGAPLQWGYLALVTFVFYATLGYLLYLALLPWLPRLSRIPRLESEHDSGLWLALGLPLLLTAAIDACLWLIEFEFHLNNVRYIAFVTVPAMWLLVRHVKLESMVTRLATVATVVILVFGAVFFVKPTGSYTQDLADDLAPRLQPGDSVGFVDRDNHFAYRFFFKLTQDGTRDVPIQIACDQMRTCLAEAPDHLDVANLTATWVLIPQYAVSHIPAPYVQVTDSLARYDGVHDDALTLWHRGPPPS